jgi:DNA-directed RNA polymerase subunit omega
MARVSIEDCLDVLENRFALVAVAATRTRQLMNGEESLVRTKNKFAVTALREIAEGFIAAEMPAELGEFAKQRAEARAVIAAANAAEKAKRGGV